MSRAAQAHKPIVGRYHQTMRKLLYLVNILLLFTFIGCQNRESLDYYASEEAALIDLLPEILRLEDLKSHNSELNDTIITFYLISELDTEINTIPEINDVIADNEKELDSLVALNMEEREKFKPFKRSKLRHRNLSTDLNNPELNIIPISMKIFKSYHKGNEEMKMTEVNSFGYIFLSRIAFCRNKQDI